MTKAAPNRQNVDGTDRDAQPNLATPSHAAGKKISRGSDAGEQASSERTRQRLTQELSNGSENAPQTREQARALVAELGTRLNADPKAGLSAHGDISPGLYSAAAAQPNA